MTRLRSEESGFTLVEVLVAATLGFMILAVTLGLLESSTRVNLGVLAKTDAMQRGRLAMDTITRQLRSQVCSDVSTPAIADARDDQVTFYADFGTGTTPPDRRLLTFGGPNATVQEFVYPGSGPAGGPYTYAATPIRNHMVVENVAPVGTTPYLRYYAFTMTANPTPTLRLATPLSAADRALVARIEIAYVTRPTGARDNTQAITFRDQVHIRHADPNLSNPDPICA
jgi:type II secretory pathway pseudopilin PulG